MDLRVQSLLYEPISISLLRLFHPILKNRCLEGRAKLIQCHQQDYINTLGTKTAQDEIWPTNGDEHTRCYHACMPSQRKGLRPSKCFLNTPLVSFFHDSNPTAEPVSFCITAAYPACISTPTFAATQDLLMFFHRTALYCKMTKGHDRGHFDRSYSNFMYI